ncbi:molybdenum cofactor biosynthesis protein MoaE [Spongisporangium articulatum]|uniref:Molybdenum cofactor biosynthesis protein MoaE n=1 Tax=Spongisporangium articulatum TaxID=3362603 RepID=A0ABW8AJD9_9ACTN
MTTATTRVAFTAVTPEPLDLEAHAAAVAGPGRGAVVTFAGVVRDSDGGHVVTGLEYVGHPTAPDVLAEVVAEVVAGSGAECVAVSHRLGWLEVGETAFAVAVSGAHRREAFETASRLVDEVKARLPVWKRQVFDDGSAEWVNSA